VQTQLHYICLTGNFRKGVVRLSWVAKWVATRCMKRTEKHENANRKAAVIFLADHDKFFIKFHVHLTPHHAADKRAEATNFHGFAFVT